MKKKCSRIYIIIVALTCCTFTLCAKKAKELIELSEEIKKPKKIVSPKLIQKTQQSPQKINQKNSLANSKQETQVSIVKNEVKKANDYFNVPVEHKNAAPKTIAVPKKDSAIQVTYLDNQKKETIKDHARKIEIAHDINESMITYHYLGARVPSKFWISYNDSEPLLTLHDKKIQTKQKEPHLFIKENLIQATVYYQFDVGGLIYRKGGKKVTYKIPESVQKITTQFSWHKPEKIIIKEAELITFQDI